MPNSAITSVLLEIRIINVLLNMIMPGPQEIHIIDSAKASNPLKSPF